MNILFEIKKNGNSMEIFLKVQLTNNLTINNQQFSEIMKNGLNEIRQEIKGNVKECKSDFSMSVIYFSIAVIILLRFMKKYA